jgi:arsenate reductase
MTAHWGIADPAAAKGSPAEVRAAFAEAYRLLHNRISLFVALPFEALDEVALRGKLEEIGGLKGATGRATAAAPAPATE